MEYKLIADSGSTKTDWVLLCGHEIIKKMSTQGINPVMLGNTDIIGILEQELLAQLDGVKVDAVDFYGAGCRGVHCEVVCQALQTVLGVKTVSVDSDMLGAARALCGKTEGVVCILGTGANSCLYDGNKIVQNVSPLGYILGDEGSGAVLGRRLIGDVLKNQMNEFLTTAFFEEYKVSVDDIIRRVYREPMPNRYLASFAPFLSRHRDCEEIRNLLYDEFSRFFLRNVANYHRKDLPVHFVGSIAYYFQNELHDTAVRLGYHLGKIKKAPLDS